MRRRIRIERTIRAVHAREDRLQCVVVALRDGIELVIVAARAVDGRTLKRAHHRAHHVVAIEHLRHAMIHRVLAHRDHQRVVPRPGGEETERHRGLRIIGEKRIARDLLLHETRVGFVLVESADDVIAPRPRIRARVVVVVAVRVRIVRDIEPVPRPVLAVARGSEELFHETRIGLMGLIRLMDKCVRFLRRWRQSREVVGETADERARIRFRRHCQSLFRELCSDESINRIRLRARHRRFHERLQRPVRLRVLRSRKFIRPARSRIDPSAQCFHLRRGQPRLIAFFRRHQHVRILAADVADERAGFRRMRHNGRLPAFAAFQGDVAHIQTIPALLLFRPVTSKAAPLQNRPHLAGEVRRGLGACRRQQEQNVAKELHASASRFTCPCPSVSRRPMPPSRGPPQRRKSRRFSKWRPAGESG